MPWTVTCHSVPPALAESALLVQWSLHVVPVVMWSLLCAEQAESGSPHLMVLLSEVSALPEETQAGES